MNLGIAGKVAFVSGGSMGMGRATAELLGQEGCRVVVAALERDQESIDETVKAIVGAGGEAVGVAGDLTVKANVERAVNTAREGSERVSAQPMRPVGSATRPACWARCGARWSR